MSVAFSDSSIENQKGGYIKPNWIKLLKYPFPWVAPLLSLSGTLSPLGSYCPLLPPHFPRSVHSDKCHRLGWGHEICGRQLRECFVHSGWLRWNQSRWNQSGRKQKNGQTEGSTSLDEYTMGRRSPCCIYCVTSLSECEGSCPGVWHISPEVQWYNTMCQWFGQQISRHLGSGAVNYRNLPTVNYISQPIKRKSRCLMHPWCSGFFATETADWLSI